MKRSMFFVLFLLMGICSAVFANEDNEGIVNIVDEWKIPPEGFFADYSPDQEPFIPENLDRSIIGRDDRVTVNNPSSYPYSAIAYLEVTGKCGCSWTCSGFMVNKDRLLTAAHCLLCTDHSSWAKYIDFYFGYKNSRNYLYRYDGKWTAWAGNIFNNRKYTTDDDYGCVKFYKNVGDTTGWFGAHWDMPKSTMESKYLYVAGYRDSVLRYDSGWIDSVVGNEMYYKMDTVPGNSGGPIFTSDYLAVGINIASGGSANIGYLLTDTVRFNLYELY